MSIVQPCSEASERASEPLHGTATHAVHWIGIELPGAWRHDGVMDEGLDATLRSWIAQQHHRPDTKVVFIKQRGRRGRDVVYGNVERGRVHRFSLSHWQDLDAIPWEGLRAGTHDEGLTTDQPIFVCTHSTRDHCCGLRGAALTRALAQHAPGQVWQSSHLGGHRFAPTLVTLPTGWMFGRVGLDEAQALVRGCDAGHIYDIERWRGDVRHPAPGQAALAEAMKRTGDLVPSAYKVLHVTPQADRYDVAVQRSGERARATVSRAPIGHAAPPSCGAPPTPIVAWTCRLHEDPS
jgi:hypothetical protein